MRSKSFLSLVLSACLLLMALLNTYSVHAQDSTGKTELVSVSSDGQQTNDLYAIRPSVTDDGRYVTFTSSASNLVPGDTNGVDDVFLRDRQSGETLRISVASNGTQANEDAGSESHSMSADGRYMAFVSSASNLVTGDTNGSSDVFVHDQQTGQTTRVSVASDGTQANSGSGSAVVSPDGRYVAFRSEATNLIAGDTNGVADIFVHDRQTADTVRVSVSSAGLEGNAVSWYWISLSEDGRYIAFESDASNLVGDDTNGVTDVFVHDRQTGDTERISVASDDSEANGDSGWTSISRDGRYVAFQSNATNLISNDNNGGSDIFVHDRVTGQTERVSVASNGAEGDGDSGDPSISADGRYVTFMSGASNLVVGDTNDVRDIFVHDRETNNTIRVSVASNGTQADSYSGLNNLMISGDGRFIVFSSTAENLVANDTNGYEDVMIHDRGTTSTSLFADVPVEGKEWMEPWIDNFYQAGITTGCDANPLSYCPEREVTRAEMAIFLLRAIHYPNLPHNPVDRSGTFADMPVAGKEWMEEWVEEFYQLGITSGCSADPLRYCPERQVTRAEMAVFILRALYGGDYQPPAASHTFADVPVAGKEWMEPWVDQFYREGITTGCGTDGSGNLLYCPERQVTRAEMAVFILRAFDSLPNP